MTEPQHVMTNPQHIMKEPQHIITKSTAYNDGITAYNDKPTVYNDGTTAFHFHFQFSSYFNTVMIKCDPQHGHFLIFFYVYFSFVRYSVYIIFRVIFHVSPVISEAGGGSCDTSCVHHTCICVYRV